MKKLFGILLIVSLFAFFGCPNNGGEDPVVTPESERLLAQPSRAERAALFDTANGFPAQLSNSWKIWGHSNPLFTQAFGADPDVMVFNDRVWIYMSNDTIQYAEDGSWLTAQNDPEGHGPSYLRGIQGIRIVSSSDMVNWTDHGASNIVGTPNTNPLILEQYWQPAARFYLPNGDPVERSWAPTAAYRIFGATPRFFLYWCDGGNGVGVVVGDTPVGPWRAPDNSQRLLVDHSTPGGEDVLWLFDPGVFIDPRTSQGYLFLGGGWQPGAGIPVDNTRMARRVRLNHDMVSLMDEYLDEWHVPFLFEAQNMKYLQGRYYFQWSTHYSTAGNTFGFSDYHLVYMMSENSPWDTFPGGWSDPRTFLTRPNAADQLLSTDNNNHGAMFEFRGRTFITYHTQKVAEAMGVYPDLGHRRLRSAWIDYMPIRPDGHIDPVQMTRLGVSQIEYLNPFVWQEAETMAVQGGIYTRPATGANNGMVVTSIDTGDWLGVYGVDFGVTGATRFTARVRTPSSIGYYGAIELRLNPEPQGVVGHTNQDGNLTPTNTTRITGGEVIGAMRIQALPGYEGQFAEVTIELDRAITGVHDLVFVFYSSLGVNPETVMPDSRHMNGFEFDKWRFF
ncbi:MAG: family 43 glycosylhydrolase [Treponema sp.]|nr:family 43 glycosylhydrolase [Treponema sp.]